MTGNCWKLCVCLGATLRVFVRDLWFRHVLAMYEDHTKSYKITVSSRLCVFTWIFLSSLVTSKTWLLIKQGLPTSASLPSLRSDDLGEAWLPAFDQQWPAICQMEICWKSTDNLCAPATPSTFSGTHARFKRTLSPQPNHLQYLWNICGAVLLMLKNALWINMVRTHFARTFPGWEFKMFREQAAKP
jgi:hypothetical protein